MILTLYLLHVSVIPQPTEADRVEAETRKKLTNFTVALQAFMDGGEDETKPTAARALPAQGSIESLNTPAALSPTPSSIDVLKAAAAAGGGGGATRAKPPAAAPPPPGSETSPLPGDRKSVPGRPPPPSAQAAMPGSRPPSLQNMVMAPGGGRPTRAKSMSPPPVSFSKLDGATEAGKNRLEGRREPRSSSQDRGGVARKKSSRSLPPGAEKIMAMGFSAKKVRAALERSGGDEGQAVEWILANPSSPEDSADEDSGDEVKPPSPSSASPPPGRKSLPLPPKKSKPLKPQNPVFDQQAFTPVLIPAKPGAIVVASGPNAWTPPGGAGGGSSGDGSGTGAGVGGGEGVMQIVFAA